MTPEELEGLSPEELADRISADLSEHRDRIWQTVYNAQDDLLFNGTDGASDESLKLLGLRRTIS